MNSDLKPSPDDPEILVHPRVRICGPVFQEPNVCTGGAALTGDGRTIVVYTGLPRSPHGLRPGEGSLSVRYSGTPALSRDDWTEGREIVRHHDCNAVGASILRDRDGVIWIFYLGFVRSEWKDGEPTDRTISNVWSTRSHDDGATWVDRACVFEGYCGATRGAIQVSTGEIVVPISYVIKNPGRYLSACLVTRDRGESWELGGSVDIGQCGDHAGAVEPSVVELRDGRLWMQIRTNLGYFMDSYSADLGRTWSAPVRSAIGSPSAPGFLYRLSSGRICLAWNNTMDRVSEVEAIEGAEFSGSSIAQNLRDVLSIAFSDDDGATWTRPVEIAKSIQLSYPRLLEISPGVILCGCQRVEPDWNHLRQVNILLNESDFVI
jgi:hypothetical protein